MIYIFPDTNILLHYKFIDELDWSFATKEDATVVISPNAYREIDDHKHKFEDTKKYKRANQINRFLDRKSDEGDPRLKNGMAILLLPSQHLGDMNYELDLAVPDDRFIASVVKFRDDGHPNCLVISADTGVKIKCKQLAITCIRPPDNLLTLEDEDPLVYANRRLHAENERLKNLRPKLKLGSLEEKASIEITIAKPEYLTPAQVQESIIREKGKYPSIQGFYLDSPSLSVSADFRTRQASRYNEELIIYFRALELYLNNLSEPSEYDIYQRIIEIPCILINFGTAPANDITIFLSLSAQGLSLCADCPELIFPPKCPVHPHNIEAFARSNAYSDKLLEQIMDPAKLSWRKEKSDQISICIKKASHHDKIHLPSPYVLFESEKYMKNFKLNFRITADNIIDPVEGDINIKVNLK